MPTRHFGFRVTLYVVARREGEFDDWYREARPRVLAALVVFVGDRQLAADATDEAFARALVHWERVRSAASPIGWVVNVARNVARRTSRRSALERRLLRRPAPPQVTPAPGGEIWMSVRRLPDRQREVVVLRYLADLPEAEIAQVLGVSRSAVSSALTDARRSLSAVLREPEGDLR